MIKFLDLYHQYLQIQPEIDRAIATTIRDSAYVGGAAVTQFEAEFAAYQGAAHCVGMANGTDAIEIGLEALALPAGSEVIVPANSFIASSEAVTRSGHRVVFADCDADRRTLSLEDVARRVTARTAAIMAVHLYGQPSDMAGLSELARTRGLQLIEDCAQAHGAEIGGRRVGTFGALSTFSFYPGKNLGAYGDAGALVTNDASLALRARKIANHGRIDKYNHEMEGRNSRLDGLQAAILSVKLRHLDAWVDRRNAIARRYLSGLGGAPGLALPVLLPGNRHAFHLFVVRHAERDALASHLTARGVQTGVHYPIALPKLAAYTYLHQADEPMIANREDAHVLSLPMGEHLSDGDVDTVIAAVRDSLEALGQRSS